MPFLSEKLSFEKFLLSPAEQVIICGSAGCTVKALQIGLISAGIIFHVQRNLWADIINCLAEFGNHRLVFFRIQSCLNLLNQRVNFRIVQSCLIGRIDRAGVINTKGIGKQIG